MPRSIYDLLRALTAGAQWRTEEEHNDYVNAINEAERLGVFGSSADDLEGDR